MKKITLLLCSALLPVAAIAAENRIPNGSFEKGSENWSYEEWKGLPLPGRIEKGTAPDGQSYFVMTEPGTMTMRFIRTAHVPVERGRNYLLHFPWREKESAKGLSRSRFCNTARQRTGKRRFSAGSSRSGKDTATFCRNRWRGRSPGRSLKSKFPAVPSIRKPFPSRYISTTTRRVSENSPSMRWNWSKKSGKTKI